MTDGNRVVIDRLIQSQPRNAVQSRMSESERTNGDGSMQLAGDAADQCWRQEIADDD